MTNRLPIVYLLFGMFFSSQLSAQNFQEVRTRYQQAKDPAQLAVLLDEMEALAEAPLEKAMYHEHAGHFFLGQYDLTQAEFHLSTSRKILGRPAQEEEEAFKVYLRTEHGLITIKIYQGEFAEAIEESHALLEDFESIGDTIGCIKTYNLILGAQFETASLAEITTTTDKSAALSLAIRDTSGLLHLYTNLTEVQIARGKTKAALENLENQRRYWNVNTSQRSKGIHYSQLGRVQIRLQDWAASREILDSALFFLTDVPDPLTKAMILSDLGNVKVFMGDTSLAIEDYAAGLAIARQMPNPLLVAGFLVDLGALYQALNLLEEGKAYLEEGLEVLEQYQSEQGLVVGYFHLGIIEYKQGQIQKGIAHLHLADSLAHVFQDWYQIQMVNEELGLLYEQTGEAEKALPHYKAALVAKDSINYLEARKYADSLAVAAQEEVESPSAAATEGSSIPVVWWGVLVLALGLVGLGLWRVGKTLKKDTEPSSLEEPVTALEPQSVIQGLKDEQDWATFFLQFEQLYPGLLDQIGKQFSDISPNDLRILALTRLSLSVSEMAELMAISPSSVKKARQRTRKKLDLPQEKGLLQFLMELDG